MSTPAVTSRWTGFLKKFGLAALFLVVLIYLMPTQQKQSSWKSDNPSKRPISQQELDSGLHMPTEEDIVGTGRVTPSGFDEKIKEFSTPLESRDWGLMGKQVKQLSDWAMTLRDNISIDPRHVNDAVLARFPYLKGAKIYKPWGYQTEEQMLESAAPAIVICAGSKNFHLASHLIVSLREILGSQIAIEVAYAGDNDLRPEHRHFMQTLTTDITFIDLLQVFPNARVDLESSGWAMKPFSILASKHRRVLLADADALFFTDPAGLFESHPDLERTGTLLYHDRAALGGGDEGLVFLKEQIAAAGIEPSARLANESLYFARESWYEADSGLVAVDKSRTDVFLSLTFVTWLNTKKVRDEVAYKLFYGDKETFWIAMELSSLEYAFQPWYAGTMGHVSGEVPSNPEEEPTKLCSTHMLHMDPSGETPFWINGGIYQHKGSPERGFADITHYWRGNKEASERPSWWWEEGDIGCLNQKGIKPVPIMILETLTKMYNLASRVDAVIQKIST